MKNLLLLLSATALMYSCDHRAQTNTAVPYGDRLFADAGDINQQVPDVENIPLIEDQKNYKLSAVVEGLTNPWGMDWLPNGDLLITEKEGKLYRYDGTTLHEIANVPPVYVRGQGGLMDVLVHPDFSNNKKLFISYASTAGGGDGGNTSIASAILHNDQLTDLQVLYKAGPNTKKGQHFGSRFAWGNDDKLYFSIGERGERDVNPQDITRDGGKIYRINENGSIPQDNPFVGIPDAIEAAYTYGNRNPQGLLKHPVTGDIIAHEHGPRGGDEINIIKSGVNYGWPVISYGINYSGTAFTEITKKEGMAQPLYYWEPSIAPSGFAVINNKDYKDWNGNFLVGSLKFQYLEMLYLDEDKVVKREKLADQIGRVRNVKIGPDGHIYIGVEGKGIYKIHR